MSPFPSPSYPPFSFHKDEELCTQVLMQGCVHVGTENERNRTTPEQKLQKQFDSFTSHCHTFYAGSMAISDQTNKHDEGIAVAKEVLKAFDAALLGFHRDDNNNKDGNSNTNSYVIPTIGVEPFNEKRKQIMYSRTTALAAKSAIIECGLYHPNHPEQQLCLTSTVLTKYSTIKSQQRRKVHTEQMMMRRDYFFALLQDAHSRGQTQRSKIIRKQTITLPATNPHAHANIILNQQRQVAERGLRAFTKQYSSVLGTQSFLGGLRTLLDKQLHHKPSQTSCEYCYEWTLDIATITEHCYAGHKGNQYMMNVIGVLLSILVPLPKRVRQDEEKKDDDDANTNNNKEGGGTTNSNSNSKIDNNLITLAIQPKWTNGHLKRFLRHLPRLHSLDVKPTGTVLIGNIERDTQDQHVDTFCGFFQSIQLFGSNPGRLHR